MLSKRLRKAYLALELGDGELSLAGHSGSVTVRDGGSSPSRTSIDSLDVGQFGVGETERDEDH